MQRVVFLLLMFLSVITSEYEGSSSTEKSSPDRYLIDPVCGNAIQSQVNEELHASLVYTQMGAYFDQNDVARKGFVHFFRKSSLDERDHAEKLIDYLNRRGSRFLGFKIKMPSKKSWLNGLEALQDALTMENEVNNMLAALHDTAEHTCHDPHLMHFLEEEFLEEQVKSITQLSKYIAILTPMKEGMGEFLFDKMLKEEHGDENCKE